jgi:hypothetical protein
MAPALDGTTRKSAKQTVRDRDHEIIELCATAMGWRPHRISPKKSLYNDILRTSMPRKNWNPLKNDAQAMAIAKRFPQYALGAFAGMCGDIIDRGALTGCGYNVNWGICNSVANWQRFRLPSSNPPVCECRVKWAQR